MPYETLKFYCNEGLVPNVKRDKNNYRIFDEKNVAWIKSLLSGPSTIPERKIILDKKREELLNKVAGLQKSIDYIDWKQCFYDDVLSGKTEYISNLIDPNNMKKE